LQPVADKSTAFINISQSAMRISPRDDVLLLTVCGVNKNKAEIKTIKCILSAEDRKCNKRVYQYEPILCNNLELTNASEEYRPKELLAWHQNGSILVERQQY
jgi:hypothetical protein